MTELNFMPHQNRVLNQTEPFNRVAYYLDMGLGKTFVGAEKMYLLNNAVNLVICQKSKIDDWVQHFTEYYPDYAVFNLTSKSQMVTFRNRVETDKYYKPDSQIVGVVNYDLVFRRNWLLTLHNFTLMLDESSLITNENAKRSRFILKMKPESVVLLSGTPTAGKYERLWSQVQLLGWDIPKKAFWNSYVDTRWVENGDGFKQEVIVGYKHVEHLKKKLAEHGAVFIDLHFHITAWTRIIITGYSVIVQNAVTIFKLTASFSAVSNLHKRRLCQIVKERTWANPYPPVLLRLLLMLLTR